MFTWNTTKRGSNSGTPVCTRGTHVCSPGTQTRAIKAYMCVHVGHTHMYTTGTQICVQEHQFTGSILAQAVRRIALLSRLAAQCLSYRATCCYSSYRFSKAYAFAEEYKPNSAVCSVQGIRLLACRFVSRLSSKSHSMVIACKESRSKLALSTALAPCYRAASAASPYFLDSRRPSVWI